MIAVGCHGRTPGDELDVAARVLWNAGRVLFAPVDDVGALLVAVDALDAGAAGEAFSRLCR